MNIISATPFSDDVKSEKRDAMETVLFLERAVKIASDSLKNAHKFTAVQGEIIRILATVVMKAIEDEAIDKNIKNYLEVASRQAQSLAESL